MAALREISDGFPSFCQERFLRLFLIILHTCSHSYTQADLHAYSRTLQVSIYLHYISSTRRSLWSRLPRSATKGSERIFFLTISQKLSLRSSILPWWQELSLLYKDPHPMAKYLTGLEDLSPTLYSQSLALPPLPSTAVRKFPWKSKLCQSSQNVNKDQDSFYRREPNSPTGSHTSRANRTKSRLLVRVTYSVTVGQVYIGNIQFQMLQRPWSTSLYRLTPTHSDVSPAFTLQNTESLRGKLFEGK